MKMSLGRGRRALGVGESDEGEDVEDGVALGGVDRVAGNLMDDAELSDTPDDPSLVFELSATFAAFESCSSSPVVLRSCCCSRRA